MELLERPVDSRICSPCLRGRLGLPFLVYVFIYLCHLSVHYMHALPTRGQKGASGSLALELQVIVSWHEDSG